MGHCVTNDLCVCLCVRTCLGKRERDPQKERSNRIGSFFRKVLGQTNQRSPLCLVLAFGMEKHLKLLDNLEMVRELYNL